MAFGFQTRIMQKWKRALTCLAAILEDPTTFPLLSSTSTPSDSSLCLIRPTLQMFALAGKGEGDSSGIIMHFNQNLCRLTNNDCSHRSCDCSLCSHNTQHCGFTSELTLLSPLPSLWNPVSEWWRCWKDHALSRHDCCNALLGHFKCPWKAFSWSRTAREKSHFFIFSFSSLAPCYQNWILIKDIISLPLILKTTLHRIILTEHRSVTEGLLGIYASVGNLHHWHVITASLFETPRLRHNPTCTSLEM